MLPLTSELVTIFDKKSIEEATKFYEERFLMNPMLLQKIEQWQNESVRQNISKLLLKQKGIAEDNNLCTRRIAGVEIPELGTANDEVKGLVLGKKQEEIKTRIEKHKRYLEKITMIREELSRFQISPIAILPWENWLHLCKKLQIYCFLDISELGYVSTEKKAGEIPNNVDNLSQEELKKLYWPNCTNRDLKWNINNGVHVKIHLPTPPKEVRDVLMRLHTNFKDIRELNYIGVAVEKEAFTVDNEIGAVPSPENDPIVFAKTHKEPEIVALITQYGNFSTEQKAVDIAKSFISVDFLNKS